MCRGVGGGWRTNEGVLLRCGGGGGGVAYPPRARDSQY